MKKIALFALFAALFTTGFVSCVKDDDGNNVNPVPNTMQYSINGLSDQSLMQKQSLTLNLYITHIAGPQEAVNLSVEGLPAGISAKLSAVSGTPGFLVTLELTQKDLVEPGKYPVKIKSVTASGETKTVTFNLTIIESCAAKLTGKYTMEIYMNGTIDDTRNVTLDLWSSNVELLSVTEEMGWVSFILRPKCEDNSIIFDSFSGGIGSFTTSPKYIEITSTNGPDEIKYIFKPR